MLKHSYLSSDFFIYFILGIVGLSFFLAFKQVVLVSAVVLGITLFFYRRNPNKYIDKLPSEHGVFLSPVNGKVVSIRKGVFYPSLSEKVTEVALIIPFLFECGIYLPATSEVSEYRKRKGKSLSRFRESFRGLEKSKTDFREVFMKLKMKNGKEYGLRAVKCFFGLKPLFYPRPGDRGRASACVGFMPLGGTVLLYLPSSVDVFVTEEEMVLAGQTVLAGLK